MRRIVLGSRPDGTSYVEADDRLPPERRRSIAAWDARPPTSGTPCGTAQLFDIGVAPGSSQWVVVELPAENDGPYHRTNTIDFVYIVDGDITLVHGEGEVAIQGGDCVVLKGADHSWRTGARPVLMSGVSQGFAPEE